MNRKVSEVITVNDIKSWKQGDLITIQAGTGSGKSYFIKNLLYPIAKAENKKILYLVNRKRLYEQFKNEIVKDKKTDTIEIFTYQKIQSHGLYKANIKSFKEDYKYIVCDEFHYFITDASYNKTTDLSLDMVLNSNNHIRIFMSATSYFILDYFEKYKKLNIIKHEIEYNYHHIEKVFFFERDDTARKFLFELDQNEKAIYFCHSAEKAYKLSKEFTNSLFICSSSNNLKRYLDPEKIENMLSNERFEEQFLFTTHTLDNGVNIIDQSLKYVIVDIEDFDVMIQCIGRKRIQSKDDKLTVLIKKMNNKSIGGRITQLNKRIEKADYLIKGNTTEDFIKKYPRQYSGDMIYDTTENGSIVKTVNEIMFCKCMYDIETFKAILEEENGYENKILKLLKKDEFELLEDYYDSLTLNDYLNTLVGKKIFKEDQRKFKEFIKENMVNTPKGSHGSLGLNTINGYLKDNDYNYVIETKKEKERGENRNKNYWIIGKITY